ncbi:LysR family transcriptional regulator [Bradyrhizobium betae]
MDQMQVLRTFVAVADKRSFVEAARALGISPTAASRGIAGLEETLGVTLLRRTTRSVALTPEGETYLDRCRHALEELDDAARAVRGDAAEPRGLLIVTAPVVFGRIHILPIVEQMLRAHAGLDVRLTLTDRVVRLVEEGVDVAVRIAELSDSALHAVRIAQVRRVLVASPKYLKCRGVPATVADLGGHDLIGFDNFTRNGEWRFGPSGEVVVKCEPRLMTNSVDAAIDAAISGLGISRVLDYQVEQHVADGRLRYLLANQDPPSVPVSLVYQANRLRSPNARALIEAARKHFAARAAARKKGAAG